RAEGEHRHHDHPRRDRSGGRRHREARAGRGRSGAALRRSPRARGEGHRQRTFVARRRAPHRRRVDRPERGVGARAQPRRRLPHADRPHRGRPGGAAMTATTATIPVTESLPIESRSRFGWAVSDALAVAGRNLRAMQRVPEVIVFSTIQPILFVLMFRYAFGGAINTGPIPYVDYLMPGIFAQIVAFGAVNTGIGLAEDLQKGLIERFRSLPMARSAVLAGRTLADLVRNALVIALMVVMGFLVGFRLHTNVAAFLFAVALAWVMATIGLAMPSSEAAQAAAFPPLALLTFASSAFVPLQTQPGWLQAFSAHQPLTITVDAVRALVLGGPTLTHVVQSVAWSLA